MSELIPNGTLYTRPPQANGALTDEIERLNLKELMWERGTSGLRRAGGYIREDLIPELHGQLAIRKYREMGDNSPVIGACLYAIECLTRNVRWKFVAANDSAKARYYADLMHGMLFEDLAMPWSLLMSEILSFLRYGFSWFEMILKQRLGQDPPPLADGTRALPSLFNDGLIGLGKLAPRSQDTVLRWAWFPNQDLAGMHQMDPWMGRQAFIPYEKSLLFRPMSYKDNPEGRSILRNSYRPYYMITHIENTEAVAIERGGTGYPTFGTPPQWWLPTASPEEVAQLDMVRRIGRNIRQDEQACLVYPLIYDQAGNELFKFAFTGPSGSQTIDTDAVIQRYELRITQSMLCDLLFLGHEDVGSFALASSKSTTQSMSLGGYLTVIKNEFQRRCLPLLWRLNAFPPAMMPTLEHGDVETVDLTELSRFILSFGRVFNLQDAENVLRQRAGLPERPGAETHPLPPSIQPTGGLGAHGGGSGAGIESLQTGEMTGQVGLPDLDRALEPQSLSLSMDAVDMPSPLRRSGPIRKRRRATKAGY